MAAPSGTVWGSIVSDIRKPNGRKGRIGIYTNIVNTNTKTTVNVQVWFWTIYSCSDGYNTFYYNVGPNVSSATTHIGSIDINHTVASGDGWNTANQTRLANYTYEYDRGREAVTYKVYAKYSTIDMLAATVDANDKATSYKTMYANTSYTVPALATYTVSYNANGGSGAPGSQTKWYGIGLTVSTTVPTRSGYTFNNWALSKAEADAGRWYYTPGSTCGRNENLTLYAVWKPNTYTVTYNANGGSGAPGSQTKTHDVALVLSNTIPTRTNYNFKGWSTTANGRVVYSAGSSYTANAGVTLYAVWELAYVRPRITNLTVSRCTSDGTISDEGSYGLLSFSWACDQGLVDMMVGWESALTEEEHTLTDIVAAGGTSGTVTHIFGNGSLSTEVSYSIRVYVQDESGYTYEYATLPGTKFAIDFKAGGNGAAFAKPAELEGVLDVGLQTYLRGGLMYGVLDADTNLNSVMTTGFYVGSHLHTYTNCPIGQGSSFILEVMSSGDIGQLTQRLTICDMNRNRVFKRDYYESYWGDWLQTTPITIYEEMFYTPSVADKFELVGSITIPKHKAFTITARGMWQNSRCRGVIISDRNTGSNGNEPYSYSVAAYFNEDSRVFFPSCTYSGNTGVNELTFYIWAKWEGTNLNKVELTGYYMSC